VPSPSPDSTQPARSRPTPIPPLRGRPATRLLGWFDRENRKLPWRGTTDPYAIWISEVMLQQTMVQTVLPRFRPFLRRFPTIRALSRAPLDDVLAAWSGLGYYARARNLHRAAAIVVARHGGRLPAGLAELRALPGMGDYMSKAVAAIAFGTRTFPVDANIRRVVSRLYATEVPEEALPAVVSPRRPGDSIAALFDLGQTICRPRNPACGACPFRTSCRAFSLGAVGDFPARPARTRLRPFHRCVAAVVADDGRLLLRRRAAGFLSGMWELPGAEGKSLSSARAAFRRHFPTAELRPVSVVEQPIAGRRVRVEIYRARETEHRGDRWMTPAEVERSASPSLTKKIARCVASGEAEGRRIESCESRAGSRSSRSARAPRGPTSFSR
jgi:A/G-specific adenine glycosylase